MKMIKMLIFSATSEHFFIRLNELVRVINSPNWCQFSSSKKNSESFDKNLADKIWSKKEKGWKVPSQYLIWQFILILKIFIYFSLRANHSPTLFVSMNWGQTLFINMLAKSQAEGCLTNFHWISIVSFLIHSDLDSLPTGIPRFMLLMVGQKKNRRSINLVNQGYLIVLKGRKIGWDYKPQ